MMGRLRAASRVRAGVAALIHGPGTMLGHIRLIFLAIALAWIVVGLPAIAPMLPAVEFGGAVLVAVTLAAWWIRGYRRGYFPAWSWPVEGAAIGVIVSIGRFAPVLGLLFLWINFRSMYGRRPQRILGVLTVIPVIVIPAVLHHAADEIIGVSFSALLSLFVMALLCAVATSRDNATVRERATTAAGAALAAAGTRAEAINAALVAALGMDTEVGAAVVAIGSGTRLRVEGAAGRCAPDLHDHVVDFGELPDALLGALIPGGYALVRGEEAGALADALRLEPRSGAILAPLAVQGTVFGVLVLALDRVPPDDLSPAAVTLADAVAITLDQILASTRLRVVVEHSPDALFLTDEEGLVRFANPAAGTLLGCPPDDLTGVDLHSLAHPDDLASLWGTGRGRLQPVRVRGADGGWIETEAVVEEVAERDGSTDLVVTVRDISERQRLELELRHAQKLESVGRLAAGVAHEINTPIQFIGDNVRFLGEAVEDLMRLQEAHAALLAAPDDPGARERVRALTAEIDLEFVFEEVPDAIKQTLDGVDRVAKIVRAMKSFGHPGNDEKAQVDLNEAVTSTLVVAANELKYVADVRTDLGELPLVLCHRGDINQVVLNLVINAAHAIQGSAAQRGRGTITVRTRADSGWAVIEVADTGTGIPPDVADKVFDQFFTTKEVGSGTGQGLALARSLVVDRHGGTIDFTTEVGVGTVFTVRLPLAERTGAVHVSEAAGALR